jgi:hypothetical protein
MKAEEFQEIIKEQNLEYPADNYILRLSDGQVGDIINSLKRLEDFEAKHTPQPKYVLSRDINGIANKGTKVFLDEEEYWRAPDTDGGHMGMIKNYIAHKDAIDPTLIVEPKEVFIHKYANFNDKTVEAAVFNRPPIVNPKNYIKFVEVL